MPNYLRAIREVRADGDVGTPGDPITFVASTAGVKRDGLDINQNLWSLDNYRANPVFLWGHDYMGARLPIGRTEVEVNDGRLMARVTFDQQDEFARAVESKYRRGFLHTVSVGWDDVQLEGQTRHDLLDLSGVPVPGDPDAVIERQRSALASLQRNIDAVLDGDEGDGEPAIELPEIDLQAEPVNVTVNVSDLTGEAIASAVAPLVAERLRSFLRLPDEGDEPNGRAGAALSKRNATDLARAVELITAVLDRATKKDEEAERGQRGQEPEPETADDELVDDADSEPEGGADGDGGQRNDADEQATQWMQDLLVELETAAQKRGGQKGA